MHEQVDALDALFFGLLGKTAQKFPQDRVTDVDAVSFGLPYGMVPTQEELLIILIDIREITYPHTL